MEIDKTQAAVVFAILEAICRASAAENCDLDACHRLAKAAVDVMCNVAVESRYGE